MAAQGAPATTTLVKGTWTQVAQQRSPPQPRLHEGLWDTKIIQASQLRTKYDFNAPIVVSCANTEEFNNSMQYFAARATPIGATVIDLMGAEDKVMATGPSGPRLATATIKEEGERPPKRRAVPSGVKGDQAVSDQGGERVYVRVTLAKAFCGRELFNRAQTHPRCLPAFLLMSPMFKKVLASRGAVAYEDEVTCLILITMTDTSALSEAGATGGAFIMSHKETAPSSAKTAPSMTSISSRRSARTKQREDALSADPRASSGLRGPLRGTPVVWGGDQLLKRVKERGFEGAIDALRRGKQAWIFGAAEPKGATDTTTFAFTT